MLGLQACSSTLGVIWGTERRTILHLGEYSPHQATPPAQLYSFVTWLPVQIPKQYYCVYFPSSCHYYSFHSIVVSECNLWPKERGFTPGVSHSAGTEDLQVNMTSFWLSRDFPGGNSLGWPHFEIYDLSVLHTWPSLAQFSNWQGFFLEWENSYEGYHPEIGNWWDRGLHGVSSHEASCLWWLSPKVAKGMCVVKSKS